MSYDFWFAGVTYAVGNIVNSNPIAGEGAYAFRCKVAGTSGDDQPAFPLIFGSTVTDGGVTWETISPVYEQLYKLEPEAIVELFHLEFTSAINGAKDDLYFHAGTNGIPVSLVFDGITYTAAPVEADGFEKKVNGALPRPTLRVANVNNAITSLMHRSTNQINPLMAKVTRIRTCKKFIDAVNFFDQVYTFQDGDTAITQGGDTLVFAAHGTGDGTARYPNEVWYIDRISSENQQLVEFELASKLELTNVLLPRRTVVEHCPWKYRGVECGYTGGAVAKADDSSTTSLADDQCGKRLKSCRLRYPTVDPSNPVPLPFGGFPGARIHD
tara:strand:+ start:18 stop:998 length:981 start_codon:yes stop_codon:yes gene_type:complete